MITPGPTIGQYYPVQSPVHRLDPRVKLLLVFVYALSVFFIGNFTGLALAGVAIALLVPLSGVPVRLVLKGVRPLVYILIITVFLHLFTGGGPWIEVGPVHVSEAGLRDGALISVRLVLLVAGVSFLTLTSTPIGLTDAIESVLSPLSRLRVPAHEVAMMLTIALRFIPTLAGETERIVKAQMARGARFDARNPFARARSFVPVLIPLFLSVFRRADELAEAMEARAYRGGNGRTRMRRLELKASDIAALVAVLAVIAAIVWVGRMPII